MNRNETDQNLSYTKCRQDDPQKFILFALSPEGDGMGPPVAQLRPRNSGLDFFWRIILCYALGLMDRVRFRGADYSLCNTFCIKSAGSKPCHTGTPNHAEII